MVAKQKYVCNVSSEVSPMEIPEMNFDEDEKQEQLDDKKEVVTDVTPLEIPKMNFKKG